MMKQQNVGLTQVVRRAPRAIIIGASHGVGCEMAKLLSMQGYVVGLMARNQEKLDHLWRELEGPSYVELLDLEDSQENFLEAFKRLNLMIGGVNLVVFCADAGFNNQGEDKMVQEQMLRVNIEGLLSISEAALDSFQTLTNGTGHLVVFSSLYAMRGDKQRMCYCATKAFVSNYLDSLRRHCQTLKYKKENGRHGGIKITELRPFYVCEEQMSSKPSFWYRSNEAIALQAFKAILKHRSVSYLFFRWRLLALFARYAPWRLLERWFPCRIVTNEPESKSGDKE